MLLRQWTDFLLKNRLHEMGAAFLFSLIPVIGGSISILIVGLVTLRKGAYEGTLVFAASILPYVLNYVTYPVAAGPMQAVFFATIIVIAINMLTWLFALILRQFGNWNLVIETAALIGIVAVLIVHLVYPQVGSWWEKELTAYFHKTASIIGQLAPVGESTPEGVTPTMIANMKNYATGFTVGSLLINALLQLVIARWWQSVLFNPGGLQKELHQIRLSYASAVILILVTVLWYFGNAMSMDILPIVLIAFSAAGLSLVHGLVASTKKGWLWLVVVYAGILFIFPIGMIAVAIAALLDTVFDFRKRLRQSTN